MLIVGGVSESSHMNVQIILTRASSMGLGIPCAFARNWVIPLANICTMCLFASRVGCPLLQRCRADWTLSRIGSQGVITLVSFPIQAPRIRTVLPSSATLTSGGSGGSVGLMHQVVRTLCLWVFVLVGMTSVFSMLNLAPEAEHHFIRISRSAAYESAFDR